MKDHETPNPAQQNPLVVPVVLPKGLVIGTLDIGGCKIDMKLPETSMIGSVAVGDAQPKMSQRRYIALNIASGVLAVVAVACIEVVALCRSLSTEVVGALGTLILACGMDIGMCMTAIEKGK